MKHIKAKDFNSRFLPAVKKAASVCLTTHVNPDGDGLAACLALRRILAHLGYSADIVVDDLDLERFDFLQVRENVVVDCVSLRYDLVIIIDLHDYGRLGDRIHLTETADKVIVIDHHEINDDMMECGCCWIDTSAVCTGWMIYNLFRDVIEQMPAEDKAYVGACLYTTLLNDTNNFTNANTDANAFELASAACRMGAKPHQIHKIFMVQRSSGEMRLLGQVLSTIELFDKGRILFMHSSLAMLEENKLSKEATSNFTRWIQDLKGVEVAVFFREETENEYKLSLRSKTVNVHAIAVRHNGGGHLQASGCTMKGSLPDLKKKILEEIRHAERLTH
jgi:phosphoesterase RecJ-like protein